MERSGCLWAGLDAGQRGADESSTLAASLPFYLSRPTLATQGARLRGAEELDGARGAQVALQASRADEAAFICYL